MNREVLDKFISTFNFLQNFNCLPAIDEMFLKIIKEDWTKESLETNKMLIVCFLRSNYSVKENLSNYQELLNKSISYLESNDVDPKSLLHGIIK